RVTKQTCENRHLRFAAGLFKSTARKSVDLALRMRSTPHFEQSQRDCVNCEADVRLRGRRSAARPTFGCEADVRLRGRRSAARPAFGCEAGVRQPSGCDFRIATWNILHSAFSTLHLEALGSTSPPYTRFSAA